MLKFIQKWLHNKKIIKNMVLVDDIGIFFYISEYFWQMTVFVYITLFSKLINVTKITEWECSNQYKVNTYHYIKSRLCVYLLPEAFSLSIIIDVHILRFHWDFFIFNYSQSQVIKLTSCLPMVGGSLRLLPPLKLVAMI